MLDERLLEGYLFLCDLVDEAENRELTEAEKILLDRYKIVVWNQNVGCDNSNMA